MTFYFDETTYRRLEAFVVEHQSQGPFPSRNEIFSSFSVMWRTTKGSRKYILSPASECTYLDQLIHSVDKAEYAKFIEQGEGLMAREGCSRRTAPQSR